MVMNIIENHNSPSLPPPIPPRPVATQQVNSSNPPPIPPRRATVTERPSNTPPPIPPRRSTISEPTAPIIPQADAPPAIPPRPRMAPPPVPGEEAVPLPPPMPSVVSEPTPRSPAESPSARSRPSRGADFESQLNSAKLKHVEQNTSFKTSGGDLASTLMRAMESRRVAIREDARDFDDDDDDWDL